jgi:hypothetical protein
MLKPLPAAASLVVCSTRRSSKDACADAEGRHGGERFEQELSTALTDHASRRPPSR